MNATIQGLPTIRAFNASKTLEKELHEIQDYNTSCIHLVLCSSRWFALSLDMVCVLYVACVTFSFLLLENRKLIKLVYACLT